MINEIKKEAKVRMQKSIEALGHAFNKIRTGRAHPGILDSIQVDYYGSPTPLSQVANVSVEDGRTLSVTPWERTMVPVIEKAILSSDLGLNPSTAGTVIRIPMPALTEETRKEFIKQSRNEAETARVSIRNIRRDANNQIKELLKAKEISEDDERRAEEEIQKITNSFVAEIDKSLSEKEKDLMEI
ncbi:MAG: ribosome recycling factor [Pseudomonadales bacterium]|nr:ribosome recycling factor [Pseudomonadales bacterium]